MTARPSPPFFVDRRFPNRLAIRRMCGPGRAALLSLSLFLLAACGGDGAGPIDPGDGRFTAFRERHRPLSAGLLVVGDFETLRLSRELEIPEAMMPSVIGEPSLFLGLPALAGLQGDGG